MKETVDSIIKWHEATFPKATLRGQKEKFKKELEEWKESKKSDITELADMLIVACGIARFDLLSAAFCFSMCQKEFEASKSDDIDIASLAKAIDEKMSINRARTWNFDNGLYQHKTEDKEEK